MTDINWLGIMMKKWQENQLEIPAPSNGFTTATTTWTATKRLPKRYPSARGYGRKK